MDYNDLPQDKVDGKSQQLINEALEKDENAISICSVEYGLTRNIIIATDRRVIILTRGVIEKNITSFKYNTITGIQLEKGILKSKLILSSSGGTSERQSSIGIFSKQSYRSKGDTMFPGWSHVVVEYNSNIRKANNRVSAIVAYIKSMIS